MKKQESTLLYFRKFKYWAKRVIGVTLVITLTYVTDSFFTYILKDYDKKYNSIEKLKELDLRSFQFAYSNDLQFIKNCTSALII